MRDILNLAKSVLVWIIGKLSYACQSRDFYGDGNTQWVVHWRNDAPSGKAGETMLCCSHCMSVCHHSWWRWIKRVRRFDLDANQPKCEWC